MEERHFSTLVSLLGEDVLSDDCLVVVTGGNDDKNQNQNQNQQFEKGENLPCILNKKYGKENYIIEDFYNFLIESNNEK